MGIISFPETAFPKSSGTGNEGLFAISYPISYPESSGFLVSGAVARRDSGIMAFLSQKIWESGFSAHAYAQKRKSDFPERQTWQGTRKLARKLK